MISISCGTGNSIGLGQVSGEHTARSPTPRGPAVAQRPAAARRRTSVAVRAAWPIGVRSQRGPIGRPAHAERPGTWAGRRVEAQRAWWAAAGRRVAPDPDGPRVEGGLRAAALAAVAARVRRCARIWSIMDRCVMQATRRITPWQVGHAKG